MTVTIRELEGSPGEYFAYTKSVCGRATYLAYFRDDIFGAVGMSELCRDAQKSVCRAERGSETSGELHSTEEPDSAGSATKVRWDGVGRTR